MSIEPNKRTPLTTEEFLASCGPGLTVPVLHKAITAGEEARHKVHRLDPPGSGGQNAYQLRIRTFRMLLEVFRWVPVDVCNCAMIRNPEGTKRILIARGDEKTASEEVPSTFYKKGPVLRKATDHNRQMLLQLPGEVSDDEDDVDIETWVLLVHTHETSDQEANRKRVTARLELSMPIDWIGDRPTGWVRNKLPELELEFELIEEADDHDFASEDDVDIDLTKKE